MASLSSLFTPCSHFKVKQLCMSAVAIPREVNCSRPPLLRQQTSRHFNCTLGLTFGCTVTDPARPALLWVKGGCAGWFDCQGGPDQGVHCQQRTGLPWRRFYCACIPPPASNRLSCVFSRTPKVGGESVQSFLLTSAPAAAIDVAGGPCHAAPRLSMSIDGRPARERYCAGAKVSALDYRSHARCVVTILREPVARFESAWRYGLGTAVRAKNTSDMTWARLLERFPRGANQFVSEARASGRSVQEQLQVAGVDLFDPSRGTGICCTPPPAKETPLLSPQHWWIHPLTLTGAQGVQTHVLCTETLASDLRRLLHILEYPAAHQPLSVPRALASRRTAALTRLSALSADNAQWVADQYAEDATLHQWYCTNRSASLGQPWSAAEANANSQTGHPGGNRGIGSSGDIGSKIMALAQRDHDARDRSNRRRPDFSSSTRASHTRRVCLFRTVCIAKFWGRDSDERYSN